MIPCLRRFHCNPNFLVPSVFHRMPSELKAARPPRRPPRPYVGLAKRVPGKHGNCNTFHHNDKTQQFANSFQIFQFPSAHDCHCILLADFWHVIEVSLARRWHTVGTSVAATFRRLNGDNPSVAPVQPPTRIRLKTPRKE